MHECIYVPQRKVRVHISILPTLQTYAHSEAYCPRHLKTGKRYPHLANDFFIGWNVTLTPYRKSLYALEYTQEKTKIKNTFTRQFMLQLWF